MSLPGRGRGGGPGRGRLYSSLLGSLGVLIVTLGVAMTVLNLVGTVGPFNFLEDHSASRRGVALWTPASANRAFPEDAFVHPRAWRTVASDVSWEPSAESPVYGKNAARVVVVTDARALTSDELEPLLQFVRSGGGVLLTGAVGAYSALGEFENYDRLRRLLQVKDAAAAPAVGIGRVRSNRRGPLSALLFPAEELSLSPAPEATAIPGSEGELAWATGDSEAPPLAAALRRELGEGRLVWLGAGPELVTTYAGLEPAGKIVRACLRWLAREPLVEVLPWPGAAPYAVAEISGGSAFELLQNSGGQSPKAKLNLERARLTAGLLRLSRDADEMAQARREGAWVARPDRVAKWLAAREKVFVRSEVVGPNRVLVAVTNEGRADLAGLALRVYLNRPVRRISVERTTLQQNTPEANPDAAESLVDLKLPRLAAGANSAYYVDLY